MNETKSYNRQIVYFINDSEYNELHHQDEGKDLLSKDEVMIVPLSESDEFLDSYSIISGIHPYNRMMLILSPNDSKVYAEISESIERFAFERLSNILNLGFLIGAKKVEIEDIYDELDTKTTKVNGHAGNAVYEGGLEGSVSAKSELYKKIGYVQYASGGKGSPDLALKFLKQSRLSSDSFLSNLIMMRSHPDIDNNIFEVEQTIMLNTNMEKSLKLAASLKIPAGNGKFEFENIQTQKQSWSCKIKFVFDDKMEHEININKS